MLIVLSSHSSKLYLFVGVQKESLFTFLTGGFTMKSSYASSGFTVVKFSCKMAIFFSLSQPAGL